MNSPVAGREERTEYCRSLALRQQYLAVAELDLQTGYYRKVDDRQVKLYGMDLEGDYGRIYNELACKGIFSADLPTLDNLFSLDSLREAYQAGKKDCVLQYRMHPEGQPAIWLETRVTFVYDREVPLAVLTVRDISAQKALERKNTISERYDAALRNIYDELYLLNVTEDSYQIIYHVHDKYVMPPESGRLLSTIGEVADNMVYPGDRQRFLDFFSLDRVRAHFTAGNESMLGEFRKRWMSGGYYWTSLTLFPLQSLELTDEVYLCFIMDIREKKQADAIAQENRFLQQQQQNYEKYRIVLEQTGTIMFEWNGKENRRLPEELPRLFAGRYDGRDLFSIWLEDGVLHPDDRIGLETLWKRILAREDHAEATIRLQERKNRQFRWYRISFTSLQGEDGISRQVICTLNDVDEATRSREALKYRAEYDTLTSIPNAQGFYLRSERMLRKNPGRRYAMIRIDVNRFKLINDIYGMEEGDKLLQYIGLVIESNVTASDACGRINSDVFGILTHFSDEKELIARVEQVSGEISSYSLGYTVAPSFGICVVDDRTVPASILCDWAKLALDTVKGNLIRNWAFFDDNLRARQLDERSIESEMEQALTEGQFVVYLQPKHDLVSGRIVGAESLVRWQHPREGLLAPWRFIPLFERNGFIIRLDEFVWERTCSILRTWIDEGRTPVPISVNVSRIQVYNVGFEQKLIALLQKYDLPAELLELELTESTFVENPEELYKNMLLLMQKGFNFSMDDFGSGYSSLNMLKNAPISTIKLDRGFLNETVVTSKGQTIIQHTIAMANQLNLKVVAEGVETETQAQFLIQAGCAVAQGFYFSKPMPLEEFNKLAFAQLAGEGGETVAILS